MATFTPILDLSKPTVNGPETNNVWGHDLNANFDKIDAWTGPLPDQIADLQEDLQELAVEVERIAEEGVPGAPGPPGPPAPTEPTVDWDPSNLSAHFEVQAIAVTAVNAGTDVCTAARHQLDHGAGIYVKTAVNGLSAFVVYWVIRIDANTFKLAATFADAKADVAFNLATGTPFTLYRHADPHGGIYTIPPGLRCDGSEGAWRRRVPKHGFYYGEWWPLDPAWAHNQSIITSMLHAVPDGATVVLPPGTFPVSRYSWVRWRKGLRVTGAGPHTVLHGDGSASSVFRIARSGTVIDRIKGGNFSGQVVGELGPNDANLSESAFVHGIALDEGLQLEGGEYGDQLKYITVEHCHAYDVDSGITLVGNMINQLPGNPATSTTPVSQFTWSRAWIQNNYGEGIRRQGIEVFCAEFVHVNNNTMFMGERGVGFAASRAVRLCGCLNWNVSNNIFIGHDETSAGNRGITVESASMSLHDDPSAVRYGGQGIVTGNYTENFSEHYYFVGARGPVKISDNIAVGNPATAPGTVGTYFARNTSLGYSEAGAESAITITIASPAVITWPTNPMRLADGEAVRIYTSGELPTGIVHGTTYYAKNISGNTPGSTFEISATLGGPSIDTSGTQSGTHHALLTRWDISKNQTDYLTIENNQAYMISRFYLHQGRAMYIGLRDNTHIGDANTASLFADFVGSTPDIAGQDKCFMVVVERNISITNQLSASGSVTISAPRVGEIFIVDHNVMSGNSSGVIVLESGGAGQGTISIRSRESNRLLPTGTWQLYNPPRAYGRFDVGPLG